MQRPVWKIEAQITSIAHSMQKYTPQSKNWYAAFGKIEALKKELVKAKQFEFLAQ